MPPATSSSESAVLSRLGPIGVRRFIRDYWQRKPCLIRAALTEFTPSVNRARLFELARDPQVESRVVSAADGQWAVQQGPFARLPSIRKSHWTLLVQGVDLHDEAARKLLSRFRFIADARLDDVMVSYATDGGGVGAHVDSYDVFLLQASGRRRWRISEQRGLRAKPGSPLRQVAGFRASQEWTLEAGDMLYLPPGVAHEGVAVGECMTYSIGFRAPSYQQLLEPWLVDYAEQAALRGRYADPASSAAARPAELPARMTRQVHLELARHRPQRNDTERFLLRYLTEPKATTVFEAPQEPLSPAKFRRAAASHGVTLDRKTRLIYARTTIGINGEWLSLPAGSGLAIRQLADQRELSPPANRTSVAVWELLYQWYVAGWITLRN